MARPRKIEMIDVNCSNCGIDFQKPIYRAKNKTGLHFCTFSCYLSFIRNNTVKKTCPQCGREFDTRKLEIKFCSRKCFIDSQGFSTNPKLLDNSRREFAADLKAVYQLLGHPPSSSEYRQFGKFHYRRAYSLFDSYKDACAFAGFEAISATYKPSPINSDELLDNIRLISTQLNRPVTWAEYEQLGKFAAVTARRMYGSFHKALIAAGFDPTPKDDWSINNVTEADGHWLSGFVEGEGSFIIKRRRGSGCSLVFSVSQREDRSEAIYEIQRILNLPNSSIGWHNGHGPDRNKKYLRAISIRVGSLPLLVNRVCPLFTRYPLRGKKRDDFRIFKTTVLLSWKKYLTDGKRHFTPKEILILENLTEMSELIRLPNVTFQNLKTTMLSYQ